MGSYHHKVAILVPDDKPDCFGQLKNFLYIIEMKVHWQTTVVGSNLGASEVSPA